MLKGDLVVVGSGDPSIGARGDHGRVRGVGGRSEGPGITAIDGRIIGDDDALDDEGLGRAGRGTT